MDARNPMPEYVQDLARQLALTAGPATVLADDLHHIDHLVPLVEKIRRQSNLQRWIGTGNFGYTEI